MVVIRSTDPLHAAEELERILENRAIAEQLDEIAALLAEQRASEFRVRAYRNAADTVRHLNHCRRSWNIKVEGLVALPAIGTSIANLIEQKLRLGRMPLLDRLRGCRIVRGREDECREYYERRKGTP